MGKMTDHFAKQLEAIGTALLLIEKLPPQTVWALCCTNDDDESSPSVLNIFAGEEQWLFLQGLLKLVNPVDRSTTDDVDQFLSFRTGTLLISLIEEKS